MNRNTTKKTVEKPLGLEIEFLQKVTPTPDRLILYECNKTTKQTNFYI